MQIISESDHEPQTDVNVDGSPAVVGILRGGTLGDVIKYLVHREEELEDLPPF
jgi:hypothetical protein